MIVEPTVLHILASLFDLDLLNLVFVKSNLFHWSALLHAIIMMSGMPGKLGGTPVIFRQFFTGVPVKNSR
jgi:hypothetical protein